DKNLICPLLFEIVKSGFYVVLGAGIQETDLPAECPSSLVSFLHLKLCIRVLWVHERRKVFSIRNKVVQQARTLSSQKIAGKGCPGDVPSRGDEVRDQSISDRVAANGENDRDRRGCPLRSECCNWSAGGDHVNLTLDEFRGDCRQLIVLTFCRTEFDADISAI